ncbi:Ni/Fe hydrogenase, partial [Aliarcobacter butzleri]
LTSGGQGKAGELAANDAANYALAIFAVGTCSSSGGVRAAIPNPAGAKALSEVTDKLVIGAPGGPPSETNIVGTLPHDILYGTVPAP